MTPMDHVATAAGVSRSTVSLALRNCPRIAAATRERVHAAAKSVGYSASPIMGQLMSQLRLRKTGARIAVVVSAGSEPTAEWLAGLQERLSLSGYAYELFRLSDVSAERLAGILRARGIEGSVILGSATATATLAGSGQYCVRVVGCCVSNHDGFVAGVLVVDSVAHYRKVVLEWSNAAREAPNK